MSKQQRAPADLELVRAFVNTRDLERGSEALASPGALSAWMSEHGLAQAGTQATAADLSRALELREAIRAILLAHNDGSPVPGPAAAALDALSLRANVQLRFDARCAGGLEPASRGIDAALGRLLAFIYVAVANGTWERLKACRDHACEWAFYDHTKNRSGAWCNMAVCGNRAKARSYRERRGESSAHV